MSVLCHRLSAAFLWFQGTLHSGYLGTGFVLRCGILGQGGFAWGVRCSGFGVSGCSESSELCVVWKCRSVLWLSWAVTR
jgi:hypothetical protein